MHTMCCHLWLKSSRKITTPTPTQHTLSGGDEQTLQQTYSPEGSASCVQNFDDSQVSAIRMTYRISLRSSSLWEPRHPLLKVLTLLHCRRDADKPSPRLSNEFGKQDVWISITLSRKWKKIEIWVGPPALSEESQQSKSNRENQLYYQSVSPYSAGLTRAPVTEPKLFIEVW